MARTTRRDIPAEKGLKGSPSSPSAARASGPAPSSERGKPIRREWLRNALEWDRFEGWCASNGLQPPPGADEAIGLVAVYVTFLASRGRSVALVARALLQAREKDGSVP
jgi:hypothetical protein